MSKDSTFEKIGQTNQHWGVCGFTSTLQALYGLNPGIKARIIGHGTPTAVLMEIRNYLTRIQAKKTNLCKDIEDFTASFPGYDDFTIAQFLARLRASSGVKDKELIKGKYGIALPPHAVVDYAKTMWSDQVNKVDLSFFDSGKNGIIGVSAVGMNTLDDEEKKAKEAIFGKYVKTGGLGWMPYTGLLHYVYRSYGKIYSFGKTYRSLDEASADAPIYPKKFRFSCIIELS